MFNYGIKNNIDKAEILDKKSTTRTHGKDIWVLLHTTTVYLPEPMTQEHQTTLHDFIKGILYFSTKFNKTWHSNTLSYLNANPIDTSTRESSMLWVCHYHNHINLLLDKDQFECNKENIAKRWGNFNSITNNI